MTPYDMDDLTVTSTGQDENLKVLCPVCNEECTSNHYSSMNDCDEFKCSCEFSFCVV